jgi:hypothetical protein
MPFALTDDFLADDTKTQQWRGFLRRLGLQGGTPVLPEVGESVAELLKPLFTQSRGNRTWVLAGRGSTSNSTRFLSRNALVTKKTVRLPTQRSLY